MEEFQIDKEYTLKKNPNTTHWDTYRFGKLLSKSATSLFKFYCLNLNNIDSLFRNYFYLSNPGDFNDPFDCNVNLFENIELREMPTVKRNNYQNIGVCSFTEVVDNHLMWAHYADNFSGWALEFGGQNVSMKERKGHMIKHTLTRVIYPKKLVKIKKEYAFAQNYLLTTKFKHWSYEKEWRFIALLSEQDREIYYFPDCVKALYIGHKIIDNSPNIYNMLLEIHKLRFPNIPVYIVYPHSTDLKLEFERVLN